MPIADLIKAGYENYNKMIKHPHNGDRSWEYCHEVFKKYRGKPRTPEDTDYLCLHLSWYLASWGMLRNSFLRDYDYKIHKDIVELLYDSRWDNLWDIDFSKMRDSKYSELTFALSKEIKKIYRDTLSIGIPTDTLLTKIMLGTIACTPAYDTYFKKTLKSTGIAQQTFSKKSLESLGCFYDKHKNEFLSLQGRVKTGCTYPSAKIVDMCFFEYSY